MQKLERLLNLTAVLLHTERPLPAAEVREKVPGYPDSDTAFRRAFERDKDDLRDLGIPIELVPVPGADPPTDGYRIARSRYYLPDPGLDPDEVVALQLAAATIRGDDPAGVEALWKLGGSADRSPAVTASLPSDPNLGPLFDAVSSRSPVRFTYHDQHRVVHPYRLGFQFGRWYLRGHDEGRDAIRVFRVDRIVGGIEIDPATTFEIPEDERGSTEILPDRWELGDEPPRVARLLIDSSHAPVAMAQFDPEHVIEHRPDGSVVVAMTVTNRAAFRSLVMSYLDHAEVLEPPELRADVIEWLRACAGAATPGSARR